MFNGKVSATCTCRNNSCIVIESEIQDSVQSGQKSFHLPKLLKVTSLEIKRNDKVI